jgi:hypothetical protein
MWRGTDCGQSDLAAPPGCRRCRPPAAEIPGMRVTTSSWDEIVEAVSREQGGREALRALVYSCAPLQSLG